MTASTWADLAPQEVEWKQKCRRFAEEVISPELRRCDEQMSFPAAVHEEAHRRGIMNVCFPEGLGGRGASHRAIAIAGEQMGSVCAPTAFTLGFNHGTLQPILVAGTSEQRQVFVRDLLKRREYASLCMTEPESSGSDLLSLRTTARRRRSGWVVSGTKCMIGMGTEASVFLVFAQTPEVSGGLSVFAVPRGPGVRVGPNIDKLGFRCVPTPTITFEDVEVPQESLVGVAGEGDLLLLRCLDFMRFGGVPVILGLVVGGLRDIVPWLEGRMIAGGDALVSKSNIQMTLGRFYGEVQAIRLLLWRTAELIDRGAPYGPEAAIAKCRASMLAVEACRTFVELMGWRGLDPGYPAQKRLRDAMATSIFEGSNDIMHLHAFRDLRRQVHAGGDL